MYVLIPGKYPGTVTETMEAFFTTGSFFTSKKPYSFVLTTWEPTFTEADLTATSFSSVTKPETDEDTLVVRSTDGKTGAITRSSLKGFWQEITWNNIHVASNNGLHFLEVDLVFIREVLSGLAGFRFLCCNNMYSTDIKKLPF